MPTVGEEYLKRYLALMVLICLLVFSLESLAFSFRPNTVKEMDVDIALVARGSFSGEFSGQDSAEIRMLTFNDSQTQRVLSIDEKLFIGEKIIEPQYEFEGNNKIAVFKIEKLKEFEGDPSFIVEIQARLKTNAKIELDKRVAEAFDKQEFLEETRYIEVNDQELKSKAELEFLAENDLDLVREIASWVNSNIEYDFENYYNGVWSAKDTYNSRKGVCDEFANLTAAFARIKKIPARYVTGISFDGERFGNHGWLEVFLDDFGWVGLDSTYLEAGYLDGAHLALATSDDASNSVNLRIITKSVNQVQVSSTLDLPDVKVNEVKFFEDVTGVSLLKPEEVDLSEDFEISAVVKNKLNSNIVIPVQLALHEDFKVEEPSRLVWFKPFEEKTIIWKATSPKEGKSGFYFKYGMLLFTPDKNVTETISVFPTDRGEEKKSNIKIGDISPFITGNKLSIEVLLENTGRKSGAAKITATHNNITIADEQVEVRAHESKKVVLVVRDVGFGEVLLSIDSDESRKVKIIVPEKTEEQIQVVEVSEIEENFLQEFLENNFSLAATILLALIIGVLLVLHFALNKLK